MTALAAAPQAADELVIDWASGPTYNTIMAVAGGVGLMLVVALGYEVFYKDRAVLPEAYALPFGALGLVLVSTGLHMTLTWPLAPIGFAFDNIVFGEPCVAFGVVLLAASLFLWRRGELIAAPTPERRDYVSRLSLPMSLFGVFVGLGCIGIAAAGWKYTLFAAPPQEPISGEFADHPMLEATFISTLYLLLALGCLLLPVMLLKRSLTVAKVVGIAWGLAGLVFAAFGSLNFFTHIGLIVNTSG
jgi:uncharacterized membrane protein